MILVSACLCGVNCKYNGGNNKNEQLLSRYNPDEMILVCPEQMGGLPTPRIPAERMRENVACVMNKEGVDVSEAFYKGAEETLKLAKMHQVELAILKAKSPSCGKGKIYDGHFNGTLIEGNGVTAELLMKSGIKVITEEEIE